jgi:hypothetical protein
LTPSTVNAPALGRERSKDARWDRRRRGVYRGIWLSEATNTAPGPVAQLVRAADS